MAQSNCPGGDFINETLSGTNVQTGRISRDGTAATCTGKTFPGLTTNTEDFFYDTYTYSNIATIPTCVTIDFDPTMGSNPCSDGTTVFDAHIVAYSDLYNPADLSQNYLGDIGNSNAGSFNVELPAGSDLVIAVSSTT
ncbi:MAG TPA: hypothetical protein VJ953_01465, partial [Saprospiraceae bacterium]|nr:hypothetical protein [Saprospiraceae bacterium]